MEITLPKFNLVNKWGVSFLNLVVRNPGEGGINGFPPTNCGNDISNKGITQMVKHLRNLRSAEECQAVQGFEILEHYLPLK